MKIINLVTVTLCVSFLCWGFSSALDEEVAKEGKCIEPDVSKVELNYDWVFSHSRWYFPVLSRLDMYRTISDMVQKPVKELPESDLTTSCLYSDWTGMTPTILGFGNKELAYDLTPYDDNVFVFGTSWRDGDGGKMFLAKTDNRSYILFVKCWDDEQVSWNVMSVAKTLDDGAKEEIMETLKTLNLSSDKLMEQDYKQCDIKDVKTEL